ncbi:hypothetical protein RDI58_024214 [Solanum bulbocastanum]|uniref:Uncharacterized protein n=1 Tax=Solanum bulbocastanum TaxID=147425 RepID=A0AAN8T2K8_SOLBU
MNFCSETNLGPPLSLHSLVGLKTQFYLLTSQPKNHSGVQVEGKTRQDIEISSPKSQIKAVHKVYTAVYSKENENTGPKREKYRAGQCTGVRERKIRKKS